MVKTSNQIGLYLAIPLYLGVMGLAALKAWRAGQRRAAAAVARDGVLTVDGEMSSHFLGGRSFGVFVTTMTLFASLFSGYTVIGVPNEAFEHGWFALRWTPTAWMICIGQVGTSVRLRKASSLRQHQSPTDFITDRFQSQLLRYTVVCLQVGKALKQFRAGGGVGSPSMRWLSTPPTPQPPRPHPHLPRYSLLGSI